MCCALSGRLSHTVDSCMSNGLCSNPCQLDGSGICNSESGGAVWRESCTDPTWESPFCLKGICTDESMRNGNSTTNVAMTQCLEDQTWCCGSMTSNSCCSQPRRLTLAATVGAASLSSTTASGAASATASSSVTATPTPTGQPSESPSNSGQMKLGLGLGLGLGIPVLVLGLVAVILLYRRRRRDGQRQAGLNESYEKPELDGTQHVVEPYRVQVHEADGRDVSEMDGRNDHKDSAERDADAAELE
ncbi:hypothetical protein AJ79_01645 [Helicocarpus griseus UAMH5409]|uniref:Mid2 domain-containing protein n=1 Tax=Helicocarpus griseus UAMH5409 TaxID=1447875 RepID=A0A2B7Y616_9EURO|nr:hypothetical protein AJ79_01645 [Helicocarpus griseus UAMH5409]